MLHLFSHGRVSNPLFKGTNCMNIDASILKNNPYFSELKTADFNLIVQQTAVLHVSINDVVFHEGDLADAFYIVKEGAIQIYTVNTNREPIILSRVIAEGFFGEQAFSTTSSPRRLASAKAQMDTVLYKIPRAAILAIRHIDQRFQTLLEKQARDQMLEKLTKLATSVLESSFDIKTLTQHILHFSKRSIIFSSHVTEKKFCLLISGEVELRTMDSEKRATEILVISPGQSFKIDHDFLVENKNCFIIAIAKLDCTVIMLEDKEQDSFINHVPLLNPLLNQLHVDTKKKFIFNRKAKIFQFRGEYLEMPTTTTVIALSDKKEILCQQVIGVDFFIVVANYLQITRKINYVKDENCSRELYLSNHQLIGMLEQGSWNNSYQFLNFIVEEKQLSECQLKKFSDSGELFDIANDSVDGQIICQCMQVTLNEIKKLIINDKADFNVIRQQTGASTICGGCRPSILELLGDTVWMPYSIAKVVGYTPNIKAFRLKAIHHNLMQPKPGQYVIMKVKIGNTWIQRNYTLTSTPEQMELEIIVKKESKGLLSSWIFNQTASDLIVYLAGPYGDFTLETTENNPIVCVVGGIGVTPALAFVRYLVKTNSQQLCHIDYTTTTEENAIAIQEFLAVVKTHNNITFHHRTTSGGSHYITENEIRQLFSAKTNCHVFLCGPSNFEKLAIRVYKEMELDLARLHVEEFIHSGAPGNAIEAISFD